MKTIGPEGSGFRIQGSNSPSTDLDNDTALEPYPGEVAEANGPVVQLDLHRLKLPPVDLPRPPFSWWRDPPDLASLGDVLLDEDGCLVLDVDDDHYSGKLTREDTLALAHAILGTVK